MSKIQLPYNFRPREYQIPLLSALDSGIKRAICIWHRRSGKDKTLVNLIAKKALERKGIYYYFFPTYAQGRKILWDGIDSDGFSLIDHFPSELVAKKNNSEMKITLKNGSIFSIIGTDDIDAIRGTNPVGCVFSEFAFHNPEAWEVVRPILLENEGWAVFNSTPNGKNHAYKLFKMAEKNPNWFCEKLTCQDTGVISEKMIESERSEGLSEEIIQREYFCSFTASHDASYYAKSLEKAIITKVEYEKEIPVDTWWDLGMADSTSIIFTQSIGQEIRIIDYLESSGEGLPYYAKELEKRGYKYGTHNAPHDIKVRELGSGKSRIEIARKLGIDFRIVKNIPIIDGINAGREILSRCAFDETKCERLLDALHSYRKDYDEKLKEFKSYPLHDWSSHASDAFRYLAVGHREKTGVNKKMLRENMAFERRGLEGRGVY